MTRQMPAMVFAAGRGTRMGVLGETCPKPLISVAGQTLIDHTLDRLDGVTSGPIVINTHHLADQVVTHIRARDVWRYHLSHEPDLLETGGGLKAALPVLGNGPVICSNADIIWTGPSPFETLLARWDPQIMDALLLLIARDRATGHAGAGDFFCDPEGRLIRRGSAEAAPFVYISACIVKTDRLAEIADAKFSLNRLWDLMIADGRAYGVEHAGGWADVGTPEGIRLAEGLLGT